MSEQQHITEPTEPIESDGLVDPAPADDAGLASDPTPEGEEGEGGEAGDPSGEGEAPEFWDLTDADLDTLPQFKRKVGEEEKAYKLKELIEHYERFGTLKQVQDVQSLYRKLEQEKPQIEQKARQEFDSYRQQVEPVIQRVQAYEQRLATQPVEVALEILAGANLPKALLQNIEGAIYTPAHEGGGGYDPRVYAQQYQAQQAPNLYQQTIQAQAIAQGDRALFQVARELKLDLSAEDEQKVRTEAAMLWNAGVRDPLQAAKQAVARLQKLGEIKVSQSAAVQAKPSLSQQIQKQLSKPKTGARQVGTGGAPERRSRALEIAAQIGGGKG